MVKLRVIISVIVCLVPFTVSLLMALLSWVFYAIRLRKLSDLWLHFWVQVVVKWLWFSFGVHPVVKGRENLPKAGEKACYIANHQSMMDIPSLYHLHIYPGIIGKVELKKIPVLHGMMCRLKCVYIDRKSLKESMKAIAKGTEQLKEGIPMAIFPEGTRSRNYEIAEFKAGSFRMAKKAGAKIVPICLQNTRKTLEDKSSFFPVKVYISILPPVDCSTLSEEELKDVHLTVENMIRKEYETLPLYEK